MIILGLTGSIGMGKSTTAAMFADEGVPVHDADQTVHKLYSGRAAPLIKAAFPGTVISGKVDRERLSARVVGSSAEMARLENLIHPLVRDEEKQFLEQNRAAGCSIVLLDIPLLFETNSEDRVDKVVVVTASAAQQRDRVLRRPGMTEEKFLSILSRQVPDREKRARADYVIDTGKGLDHAREAVRSVVQELLGKDGYIATD